MILCGDGTNGFTLRVLESLFFEKKLITNNINIINCEFYNKNNIFIINKDNLDDLNDFLKSEYKKIDKKIINYFDYESWLNRFFETK